MSLVTLSPGGGLAPTTDLNSAICSRWSLTTRPRWRRIEALEPEPSAVVIVASRRAMPPVRSARAFTCGGERRRNAQRAHIALFGALVSRPGFNLVTDAKAPRQFGASRTLNSKQRETL